MKDKIIALDLDGTLARDDSFPSAYTTSVIKSLTKKGYTFVLTTGRSWLGTKKIYEDLQLDTPVVLYNGSYVFFPRTGEVLHDVRIPQTFVKELISRPLFAELLDNVILEIEERVYVYKDIKWQDKQIVGDFHQTLHEDTTSCVLVGKGREYHEKIKEYVQSIQPNYSYRYWGNYFGEVYQIDNSKATGILKVLEYYQKWKEDLVFFGDAQNDVEIMELAGIGVAMANAKEHIQQKANQVTDYNNNEDGCVKHILKMIFQSKKCFVFKSKVRGKKLQRLIQFLSQRCDYFSWKSLPCEVLSEEEKEKVIQQQIEKYHVLLSILHTGNEQQDKDILAVFKKQLHLEVGSDEEIRLKVRENMESMNELIRKKNIQLPEDFKNRIVKKEVGLLYEYFFAMTLDNIENLICIQNLLSGLQITPEIQMQGLSFYEGELKVLEVLWPKNQIQIYLDKEDIAAFATLKIKVKEVK